MWSGMLESGRLIQRELHRGSMLAYYRGLLEKAWGEAAFVFDEIIGRSRGTNFKEKLQMMMKSF